MATVVGTIGVPHNPNFPELVAREWRRIIAERAGLAEDATAEPGAADGFDVAVDEARVG